jgi:hypothetical protein
MCFRMVGDDRASMVGHPVWCTHWSPARRDRHWWSDSGRSYDGLHRGNPVQQAAAMSLVIVAGSALIGAWNYGRAGFVKGKAALAFSWTGILGSWIGAYGNSLV